MWNPLRPVFKAEFRLFSLRALLGLLLTHQLLVALLEFRFLAFRLLRGVRLHDRVDLVVVDHAPDDERLPDGEDIRQQVVVAKAARIAVEPEEHHNRHHVDHHKLHAGHLGLRRRRLLVVEPGVSEQRHRHQQGEQRNMIAVEGNRERQVHDAVVRREVVGPQEGLLAQLDRRGEEAEHGDQDRHLDQHRNTAAHGVDARLFIKLHRRLLLFHGIRTN